MTKTNFFKIMFVGMAMLFSGSALAFDASSASSSLSLTNDLPSNGTFKIAAVQFLPDMADSGLGYNSNQVDYDYNTGACSGYSLSECPSHGNCSSCPYDANRLKLDSCASPYVASGNFCACPPAVTLGENEKCLKYCTQEPHGSSGAPNTFPTIASGTSVICVEKTCVPKTQTDTSKCSYTTTVSDGCGGYIKACVSCTKNSIKVTPPINAHVVYSTCWDSEGEHSIPRTWECDDGFKKSGTTCVAVCEEETCSGYTLSSCPSNANCETCTLMSSSCTKGSTKYKLLSCKSGYVLDGQTCVTTKAKCESMGYHTMDYWNAQKPSDSSSIFWDLDKISHFKKAFTSAFNQILGVKEAHAIELNNSLINQTDAQFCSSCHDCTGACAKCCSGNFDITVVPTVGTGNTPGNSYWKGDNENTSDTTEKATYSFQKSGTCPYDSSYVKGSWVKD